MCQSFFDTSNSLCLAPPLPTLGGPGANKPELGEVGGSGLGDCLAKRGVGGPLVLNLSVKDRFVKLEIWLFVQSRFLKVSH